MEATAPEQMASVVDAFAEDLKGAEQGTPGEGLHNLQVREPTLVYTCLVRASNHTWGHSEGAAFFALLFARASFCRPLFDLFSSHIFDPNFTHLTFFF